MCKKMFPIVIMAIALLVTGCFPLSSSSAPEGFTIINSFEEDGGKGTVYTGSSTDAYAVFDKWLKDDGWSEVDQEDYMEEIARQTGVNLGHYYEKGNQLMFMIVIQAGSTATVTTTVMDKK